MAIARRVWLAWVWLAAAVAWGQSPQEASRSDLFPPELVAFVPEPAEAVFRGAGAGHWDQHIRERGWILREGDVYRLWYTGYDDVQRVMKLGYATSRDGVHWTRHAANPIYDAHWVEDMMVVRQGDTYYMFAEGEQDRAQLLTSPDGITWSRVGRLDVRKKNGQPIEPGPYGTPTAWFENGTWYLFYERRDLGVWLATSTDLKVWTNVQDEPVIPLGPGEYDREQIALNQIIRHGGRYYAYYHGAGPVRDGRRLWCTCVATSTDLVHWEKYPRNPLFPVEENKSSGILVHDGQRYLLYTMHAQVQRHVPRQAGDDAPASRSRSSTVLGIQGTQFTLGGRPTFLLGISYYGGLGATEATIRRDLDDLKRHGFNWIRVWATWAAFGEDVSAVDAQGHPRAPYLEKLRWLVAACDRRGIVVDVTLSRGNGVTGPARLQSLEAHQRAVQTLAAALAEHRNWYLDLGNERNIRDQRHVSFEELKSLRQTARAVAGDLLVTASHAGGDLTREDVQGYLEVAGVDFLSPHRPRRAGSPAQTEEVTRRLLTWCKELGREVPIHYQEPFRRGYGNWQPTAEDFLTDLQGARAGGAAGWCFHNGDTRQAPDGQPRRSFDLREKRLFDQLDPEEQRVLKLLQQKTHAPERAGQQHPAATPAAAAQTSSRDVPRTSAAASPFEWQTAPPESQGMSSPKLQALQAAMQAKKTHALLVIRNDKIVWEWYAPGHDAQRRQGTASLAKAIFGGLSLAVAMTDGKVSLDDPAARYIASWSNDPLKAQITLRHLGSHTSGLDDAESGGLPHNQLSGWKGDFWKRLPVPDDPFSIARDRTEILFKPGQRLQYSNPGIAMLGYCVTAAIQDGPHKDLRTLLRERVMRPIGIEDRQWSVGYNQTFEVDGLPLVATWGGGTITPRAAARLGRLVLREGDWEGQPILSPQAVRAVAQDAGLPGHCGMGWWTNAGGRYPKLPRDAIWGAGAGDQLLLVIPNLNLILVRNGQTLAPGPDEPPLKKDDVFTRFHDYRTKVLFEPLVDAVLDRPTQASAAPYPPSPVITHLEWAPRETIVRQAPGSDNWPLTWGDDDHLYTAYGDGRGFAPHVPEKLSLGLARIEGGPEAFRGVNLPSPTLEQRGDGPAGKKASGILMVDGVLYLWVRNAGNAQLAWSRDRGQTWHWADWKFTTSFGCPTFLQFGQGGAGARDRYVYIYSPDSDSAYEVADGLVLARVPRGTITERAAYEFFAGLDDSGQPRWTSDLAQRRPVLVHPGRCYRTSVSFHSGLKRYLCVQTMPTPGGSRGRDPRLDTRFEGGLAIFDAPQPWGPWTTVFYADRWDVGPGDSASLPTKWMQPDALWLVFSGDDAFSVRQARLHLAGVAARAAPSSGSPTSQTQLAAQPPPATATSAQPSPTASPQAAAAAAAAQTGPEAAAQGPAAGPLRVHPDNPRYFTDGMRLPDGTLRAVYLTGSHTWNNLVDMPREPGEPPLDYTAYLDFLTQHGHNFIRLWAWDSTVWDTRANGRQAERPGVHRVAPHPWRRTGPGEALDGLPKFDLTQFDPAYFQRLRQRVEEAGRRGIYVSVMLFEGWGLFHGNRGRAAPEGWAWRSHPFHPSNNINQLTIPTDPAGVSGKVHALGNEAVTALQAAYIRKVVDTVNDLDNVLFEVINEGGENEWDWWVVRTIHEYERTKPKQHPVGLTGHGAQRVASMLASPADWVSPGRNDGYGEDPPAWNENKPSLLDTDHIWGVGGHVDWAWKSFVRGHNPLFMDPYQHALLGRGDPQQWEPLRHALGQTRRLAQRLNLAAMAPRSDLASTGYCLAEVGRGYVVYLPQGGQVRVDLTGATGMLAVAWIDPVRGTSTAGQAVRGGSRQVLTAPRDGAVVLYLRAE